MAGKIYTSGFKKSLRSGSGLSPKQRAYAQKVFGKDLQGGLSKFEVERKCRQLKSITGDPLRSSQIAKIKTSLLKNFK